MPTDGTDLHESMDRGSSSFRTCPRDQRSKKPTIQQYNIPTFQEPLIQELKENLIAQDQLPVATPAIGHFETEVVVELDHEVQ